MIKGADISHHNGADAVKKIIALDSKTKFFIIKASEGKTWRDPLFKKNVEDAKKYGMKIGAYHFARPDNNNTPEEEASHFLNVCYAAGLNIGDFVMVLDYEGQAHGYGEDWAYNWLVCVYRATGVRPIIYLSESFTHRYPRICDANFGLWVANRNKRTADIRPWDFMALWQYSEKPYDKDYFNGTEEQWDKYCKSVFDNTFPDIDSDDTDEAGYCGCSCECCRRES